MFKKLLAAVFAASLVAGSAWGATNWVVGTGDPDGGSSWVTWTDGDNLPDSSDAGAYGIVSNSTGNTTLTNTPGSGTVVIGDATNGLLLVGAANDGTTYTPYSNSFTLRIAGGLTVNTGDDVNGAAIWVGRGNTLQITGALTATKTAGTFGIVADGAGSVIESGTLVVGSSAATLITAKDGGTYKNLATAVTEIEADAATSGLQFFGGDMSFGGKLEMTKGTIATGAGAVAANKTNTLAVGGDGLEYKGAGAGDAILTVAADSILNVKTALGDEATLANVKMTGGTISFGTAGTADNTVLNVGKLTIDQAATNDVVFLAGSIATAKGTINATGLVITGTDSSTNDFVDAAGVATVVSGLSEVYDSTYTVAGDNNQYKGGLDIKTDGILNAASAATITTGTTEDPQYVTLYNDATLKVTGAFTFTVNGAGVKVVESAVAGTATNIDASSNVASIIAIQNDLIVDGNLNLKTNGGTGASAITVGKDYTQISGNVTESGINDFTVAGKGTIGGEGKVATYNLISDGTATAGITTFTEGLTIGEQGTLKAIASGDRAVNLGADSTLKLDGGIIDASALVAGESLTLNGTGTTVEVTKAGSEIRTAGTTPGTDGFLATDSLLKVNVALGDDPSLTLTGTPGASFADVQVLKGELALGTGAAGSNLTTAKDVLIKSGAFLTNAGTSGINTTLATGKFTAEKGSYIDAEDGSYTLTGFASTELNGYMTFGETAGTLHVINDATGTETKVGNDAVISLTMSAAQAAAANPGTVAVITSADPTTLTIAEGAKFQNSGLGQFEYGKDLTTGNIFVMQANNVLTGAADETDLAQNLSNMQTAWANKYGTGSEIDQSLANAAYDAAGYNTAEGLSFVTQPTGSLNEWGIDNFGQLGLDLLSAAADTPNAARYTEGVGKSILRNGDVSETLNAGVGEIRGITSAIGTRNVQLRGQMAGANDVYYEYANPTLLLNNDYANRIWAGYIGQWEKGDSRNNVSGYDYDSHGFIIGYDRLVGCNFAFGGAFAYSRGDYEDKSALTNSSKLDNYSVNGYATYSALNGVFASLFGGYTHQKNDIGASYRGGSIGSTGVVSKWSDYDTDYWNIGGQLGYDFQPVDGLVLTPSIGLQYIHGRADSHFAWARDSLGAMGGYVNAATQKSLLLPIEIAARYTIDFSDCSRLAIEGNLGYSYNFIDDDNEATMTLANVQTGAGNAIVINGYERDAGRHTFNAGAGLRYTFNRFDIGVKYDYYLQQDAHAHRVMGSVGVSF